MNDKESKIFYEVLDVLNKKKIEHPKLFNNTKIKFETIISCAKYLGIKGGKTSLTNRLSGKVKSLYKNKYWFEYCDE